MNQIKRIFSKFSKKQSHPQAKIYQGIKSIRRQAKPFYYAFRSFFRMVIYTQHSEIQAIGQENIPPDGSVMLVGNHPNSYLDYFHLINAIRHPVATAAKDVITNWPILGPILRNHVMMIPIARRQDQDVTGSTEEERKKANEESIRETVDLLVQGRLYNIFGEGRSTDSRKLNKIKLGFMHIALLAEREFNYKLNLRIVPFGFFYDRINKFQSSAVIIFGKPFKLSDLATIPDNFLSLSPSEQSSIEKKIMVAGKKRLQACIENSIISIQDKHLIDLIDDTSALYVLTPRKYIGTYKNIREKYHLSKLLSDCIQNANQTDKGRIHLEELKKALAVYRRELTKAKLKDAVPRREHDWAEFGYHVRVLVKGLILAPLIIYGKIFNWIPHRLGRLARYVVIEVQKRPKVEGDEQAIIAALISALTAYPIFGSAIGYALYQYGLDPTIEYITNFANMHRFRSLLELSKLLENYKIAISVTTAIVNTYLMARMWRFAIKHSQEFKAGLFWIRDSLVEFTRRYEVTQLRAMRHDIIDQIDFVIGEHDNHDG